MKPHILFSLLFVSFFLISSDTFAQKGILQGKVSNEDGSPAAYAIVSLIKDREVINGAYTDSLGFYIISEIASGTYEVKAEVFEAMIIATNIPISDKQNLTLNLHLPKAIEIDTIFCGHTNYPKMSTDPIQFHTIGGKDFRNSALGRN